MISSVGVESYKCFAALRLPLGALTLLTGYNAGGKSSATQPLLLVAQTLRRDPELTAVALNGPLVRLGTAGDVLPAGLSGGADPTFAFDSPTDSLRLTLAARAGERTLRVREAVRSPTPPSGQGTGDAGESAAPVPSPGRVAGVEDSLRSLVFLSAVRGGTADAYPIPDTEQEWQANVGLDGRFAAYWLDRTSDDPVAPERRHPGEPADSVRKQLDAWMGALFPGAQANAYLLPEVAAVALQFRLREAGEWRRPANVGYGLTYAFPILVALLTAHGGQTVIVDSPEAHLHPSAQSQMGRVLAHFAACGVQIVVETHSDHLLNGCRLAVRDGRLAPDTVQVHFFAGARGAEHGVSALRLDAEGRVDDWPRGFFDQAEQDLASLAGWG